MWIFNMYNVDLDLFVFWQYQLVYSIVIFVLLYQRCMLLWWYNVWNVGASARHNVLDRIKQTDTDDRVLSRTIPTSAWLVNGRAPRVRKTRATSAGPATRARSSSAKEKLTFERTQFYFSVSLAFHPDPSFGDSKRSSYYIFSP